jgi:hypothetical protein
MKKKRLNELKMHSSRRVSNDLKAHSRQTMPNGRKMHALSNKTAGFLGIRHIRSVFGAQTKRPEGQNIWRDKTYGGTKRPADKTSMGTKHAETEHPWDKTKRLWRKKHPWEQNIHGDKMSGNITSV